MIKNTILILGLLALLVSCRQKENMEELKKDFLFDFGVYVEKFSPDDDAPDRYTRDNQIYVPNRTFIYDYYIVRNGDTLKIEAPFRVTPQTDYQRAWDFVPANSNSPNKIETISIEVLNGISNEQQTQVMYNYQFLSNSGAGSFNSVSGVIENKMNVWMHPHRDKYFMILELNPFPYIQKPYERGNKWTWTLGIGDHWQDERWKTWSGSIRNHYEYEITGKEKLKTKIGTMECWVIQAAASSEIGATGLVGYFNETNGFVKLDYINIDRSRLIIEIKEIK